MVDTPLATIEFGNNIVTGVAPVGYLPVGLLIFVLTDTEHTIGLLPAMVVFVASARATVPSSHAYEVSPLAITSLTSLGRVERSRFFTVVRYTMMSVSTCPDTRVLQPVGWYIALPTLLRMVQ